MVPPSLRPPPREESPFMVSTAGLSPFFPLESSGDDTEREVSTAPRKAEEYGVAERWSNKFDVGGDPDAPLTDSGYASMPTAAHQVAEVSAPARVEAERDHIYHIDETRTIISAATTAMPTVAQKSISEVCSNIYDEVRKYVDNRNRDSFFRTLPGHIKAFAIGFAFLDWSELNCRIMHFVYGRHLEIASQLWQMFQVADDDHYYHKPQGGMSIEEKMRMWESKPPDHSPEPPDTSDFFQGVEDANDSLNHPELPLYSRSILDSEAYKWFIGNLLKEATFHWDCSLPRTMVDVIRYEIVNALPKGRVSKTRGPCIHEAVFRVPWQPIEQRLLRERDFKNMTVGEALPTPIVLVGSAGDHEQATTVEEYVVQTWGPGGNHLLEVLGAVFDGNTGLIQHHDASEVMAEIRASTQEGYLNVLVKGIAYSIAKHGEQLAWLSAALQNPNSREILKNSTPSISKSLSANTWVIQATVTPSVGGNTPALTMLKKLGWIGNYAEPVVARGFPTRRVSFRGIELSPNILALLTSNGSPNSTGILRLVGTDGHLNITKVAQGVCLWHIVSAADELCQCRKDLELHNLGDIQRYRYVVADCWGLEDSPNELATAQLLCHQNNLRFHSRRL